MFENWKKIFYALQEDHAVKEIYQNSKVMMMKAYDMLDYSIGRLRLRKTSKENFDIYKEDKELNELEVGIRRKLFIYQTSERPNKNHSAVIIMSLISHDIERIGDYSKNIFQLSERYDEVQKFGEFNEELKKIENLILVEFRKLNSYFNEFDNEVHKSIGEGLTMANQLIGHCLKKLQEEPEESGLNQKTNISLVLYLRFMKRASSHLRNIASSYYNPIDRIGFKLQDDK
ncbi:MAG: hypothetical protein KDC56_07365 [Flavobacteriaceae bacterium]|nr:hypothetical protein [Flavobacteriaceae bacterium]